MVNSVWRMCERSLFSDFYSSPFSKFCALSTADSLFYHQEKIREKEMLVTSAVTVTVVYPLQMAGTFSVLFSCPLVRRHLKRYLIPRCK